MQRWEIEMRGVSERERERDVKIKIGIGEKETRIGEDIYIRGKKLENRVE